MWTEDRNAVTFWGLLGFALVLGGVGARIWYRRWRKTRIAARRVVEKPNSHYSSAIVKHQVDQERWRTVDLDRIHPVNREEVERLLAVANVQGPQALSNRERLFLEVMTELSPG